MMEREKENGLYALAIERLRETGVKFTVDSLCKEARLSKKTFYLWYPSKGDFAKRVYSYAKEETQHAEFSFRQSPTASSLCHYLTWVMNVAMITSKETFNLYSLHLLLQQEALALREETRQAFQKTLLDIFPSSVTSHPSFLIGLEKILCGLSHENNHEMVLSDLSEVLISWIH